MDIARSVRKRSLVPVGNFPIPVEDQTYVFLHEARAPGSSTEILYFIADDDRRRWQIHGPLPPELLRAGGDSLFIDMPGQSFRWVIEHQWDVARDPRRLAYQRRHATDIEPTG